MAGSNLVYMRAKNQTRRSSPIHYRKPSPMKKMLPSTILAFSLFALAFTSAGCRAARNDARLDKLESRVSALEAKVEMMQKH